jgi:putative oxidoreductase
MDWARLRAAWEPRVLSILRLIVGLLFLEHGLGKIFNFPAAPNHRVYELLTLARGWRGCWRRSAVF